MTSIELRKFHQAQPFQPFDIYIADGRKVQVDHSELLAVSPSGRTLAVYDESDAAEIIDLLLVTSLKRRSGKQPHRTSRRR